MHRRETGQVGDGTGRRRRYSGRETGTKRGKTERQETFDRCEIRQRLGDLLAIDSESDRKEYSNDKTKCTITIDNYW